MKRKKGPFLTFCFSCMPGAGQMFLGFFKEGVSLMTIFFGIIAMSDWLYVGMFGGALAVIVWFYAFFDAMNKNSMPDEEFAALEDKYIWSSHLDGCLEMTNGRGRKIFAVVLIFIGVCMLGKSVVSALARMGIYISYEVSEALLSIPQIIAALVIIAVGIRMIIGKKKAFDFDDEKYFDGREDK